MSVLTIVSETGSMYAIPRSKVKMVDLVGDTIKITTSGNLPDFIIELHKITCDEGVSISSYFRLLVDKLLIDDENIIYVNSVIERVMTRYEIKRIFSE